VRIAVETPVNLSPEARALFETLDGVLGDEALPRRRAFREAARSASSPSQQDAQGDEKGGS
jgi:hypothetical protein